MYLSTASHLFATAALACFAQGTSLQGAPHLPPNHVAGRSEGDGSTGRMPPGTMEPLQIPQCADNFLWAPDGKLSSEDWFLNTTLLKSELSNTNDSTKQHYRMYDSVYDKAILFAHLAKFDSRGLKARFAMPNDCSGNVSVGFSDPAVLAARLPTADLISVDPRGNPYARFFGPAKGFKQPANTFEPAWIHTMIYALERQEQTRVPEGADHLEYLRYNLEVMANATAVKKTITYNANVTMLSAEDQNILFNADHSPVFLAGKLAGIEFVKPVSKATDLEDLSQATFTYSGFNNPFHNVTEAHFKFSDWYSLELGQKQPYQDALAAHPMQLIYLQGAGETRFDNSSTMLNEKWTVFSNGRFS